MSVNKVMLLGRLGQDPETKMTQGGQTVCTLSLATSEKWTTQNGEKKEKTTWHRVILWGRLGEIAGRFLQKGREVFIEGRIDNRSYDDKNGEKRYVTEIIATDLNLVGGAPQGGGAPGGRQQQQKNTQGAGGGGYDDFGPSDSDVPF